MFGETELEACQRLRILEVNEPEKSEGRGNDFKDAISRQGMYGIKTQVVLEIKTFGCQMNEYDSNRILDIAKKIDYFPTTKKSDADCYIINTCHIREKATEKVFHDIGRVKKNFRNKNIYQFDNLMKLFFQR